MASPSELQAFEDINCTQLTTGMFSDVTLVAGEKTAAAHKLILSARSSVFAALFAELSNAENRVEIDVQADVLEHFIAFIYTGKVPALEPKMAQDLLAAAEKYKLEQLKTIAEDYLCDQLSLGSVASLLQFAKAVNATKLKDKCMELLNSPASPPTTPRPLPPVDRLHDPCLVALFRQLPPADQITARTVCPRWADLVPYAARSTRNLAILVQCSQHAAEHQLNFISHGRHWHLLKLLRKEDGTPLLPMHSLSQWNSLQFSTLDEQTVTQIMATFPVLKELQLSARLCNGHLYEDDNLHCDCCTATTPSLPFFDHLALLLEHWRSQLTTLKLYIWGDYKTVSSCYRLGAAISSLSALKHLCLNLYWNEHLYCPPLSNLPQLTHFTVYSNPDQFLNILRQHDPLNSAPVQICYEGDYSIIPQLASLNANLRHRLLRIDDGHPVNYRTVCAHFPSLTSVYLALSNATFRDFLTSASQLTQLVHLKLQIDFEDIRPDDQPHRLLSQLKSVKLLHLVITKQQSHSDLEPLNLPWTMPNLQMIYFAMSLLRCTPCGIINRPTPNEKKKHCLRQMFAPLKRHCAQLHTIKHSFEFGYGLGTAEEILAEPIIEEDSPPSDTEPMDVSADNSTGESL